MDLDSFPLGRVNVALGQAYLGGVEGVEAIRLDTGQTAWIRPPGAQVICRWQDQVVGLLPAGRTAIRLVWLDAQTGVVRIKSEPAIFPMGVDWSQLRFSCGRDSSAFVLKWEGTSAYRGGAPPQAGIQTKRQPAAGAFRLNPANATMEPVTPVNDEAGQEQWKCGDRTFGLERTAAGLFLQYPPGGSRRLVAKSRNTSVLVAADGCSLLVDFGAGAGGRIFRVESGESRALTIEGGTGPTAVVGDRIFYLIPKGKTDGELRMVLKAIAIDSGKTIWQREVQPFRGGEGRVLRQ